MEFTSTITNNNLMIPVLLVTGVATGLADAAVDLNLITPCLDYISQLETLPKFAQELASGISGAIETTMEESGTRPMAEFYTKGIGGALLGTTAAELYLLANTAYQKTRSGINKLSSLDESTREGILLRYHSPQCM
jgi:hypothetical protein